MTRSPFFALALVSGICVTTLALSAPVPAHQSNTGVVVGGADMLAARSGHSATLLPNGRVLLAGGMRRNQDFYHSAELFDPKSGKFLATGDMLVARVGHAAVLLPSGKVLIAGGWIGQGVTDEAELYDPTTGKFTAIAHMTIGRGRPEATLLRDGNVLVTGGGGNNDGSGSTILSAEIFDAVAMKFRPTGSMHHARIAHTAILMADGCVLVAGGRGSEVNASAEIYDPTRGTFKETGRMITARYKHTAGLLPDGRVLLAGGSDERDWHGNLNSAEIYDPQRGTFTPTASLHNARFKLPGTAVQLRSGQLLIAGGDRHAEIYDGRSGDFTVVAGGTGEARHYMTETLLNDGNVLLTGGYANDPEATAKTWIFRP